VLYVCAVKFDVVGNLDFFLFSGEIIAQQRTDRALAARPVTTRAVGIRKPRPRSPLWLDTCEASNRRVKRRSVTPALARVCTNNLNLVTERMNVIVALANSSNF